MMLWQVGASLQHIEFYVYLNIHGGGHAKKARQLGALSDGDWILLVPRVRATFI